MGRSEGGILPVTIPRYGTPNGMHTFGFLVNENLETESIVYAETLIRAIGIFRFYSNGNEPWSIRFMADNE